MASRIFSIKAAVVLSVLLLALLAFLATLSQRDRISTIHIQFPNVGDFLFTFAPGSAKEKASVQNSHAGTTLTADDIVTRMKMTIVRNGSIADFDPKQTAFGTYSLKDLMLGALQQRGIKTDTDLDDLLNDNKMIQTLQTMYMQYLCRKRSEVDPLAIAVWGPILHQANSSASSQKEVLSHMMQFPEYIYRTYVAKDCAQHE